MVKKNKIIKMGDGQPSRENWTVVKKSFSVKKDILARLVEEQGLSITHLGISYSLSEILDQFLRPALLPQATAKKTRKGKKSKGRK